MATETPALGPLNPGEQTAHWFEHFATVSCGDRFPLYGTLARGLVGDSETRNLALNYRGQPPHILLAAVHFLLLKGIEHPLAEFYPGVTPEPRAANESTYDAFRNFCSIYRDRIRLIVESKVMQTNEVGRCSYLCLVFGLIAEREKHRPLSLIEIGARAGLNLIWDKYTYRFRDTARYGDPSSPVGILCEFRGDRRPSMPTGIPEIVFRRGIDVNPSKLDDPAEALWIRALVWPEDLSRANRLLRAMVTRKEFPVEIVTGDGKKLITKAVEEAPNNSTICVFHSHTTSQWTVDEREEFRTTLDTLANGRRLYRIAVERNDTGQPELELTSWNNEGKAKTKLLARVQDHGQWIEWLA